MAVNDCPLMKSAITEYQVETGPHILFESVSVVAKFPYHVQRKIGEPSEIVEQPFNINCEVAYHQ